MQPVSACFACGSSDLWPFYEQRNVPANSCLLVSSRAEALDFPRGDIVLAFCRRCGFIQNLLFDAGLIEYSDRYEGNRNFSGRFNQFAEELADHLVESYDLRGKRIMEIGCGKGDFLLRLCRLGNSRGLGIDPAYVEGRTRVEPADSVEFIRDFYSEQYVNFSADFIACRHTLEHVQPVQDFVGLVRRAIGRRREPVVFFDVPDAAQMLERLAFWDVHYEHCSYFSTGSLARLFRDRDFDIFNLTTVYGGHSLQLEAVAANSGEGPFWESEDDMPRLFKSVFSFRESVHARQAQWSRLMRKARMGGKKVVLWGSGSKAVSFLTGAGLRDECEFVVDINPYRQGRFLPGSGHEIVSPQFLREYRPDVVIAMNALYRQEIQADLDRLGVPAELRVL